jgi:hypothetical protein
MTEMNEPAWELQKIIDTILTQKRIVFERILLSHLSSLFTERKQHYMFDQSRTLELLEIDWISRK